MKASVPGTVHTDLLANKKIPDPFYRLNESAVQWVDSVAWEYRRSFRIPARLLKTYKLELAAAGLDTYATIRINGKSAGSSSNMFIEHRFDVTRYLRAGMNRIEILLDAPEVRANRLEQKHGRLAVSHSPQRVYVRKAQYSFGWDWGPKLTTSGIWRRISIEATPYVRLAHPFVKVLSVSGSEAHLELSVDIRGISAGPLELRAMVKGGRTSFEAVKVVKKHRETLRIRIPDPELWWPSGSGSQPLYSALFFVSIGGKVADRVETTFAIRTVKLLQDRDREGTTFIIEVNGVKTFCKGADWIPCDTFLPRVSDETYTTLLTMARDAHMNMIRVWGGGIYEEEIFYELCDRLGLMVWQDFMYACGEYPEEPWFLNQARDEAESVVRRLRNHASIVLWCGNNECEWSYCTDHPGKKPDDMRGARIFRDILKRVCRELDGTRPYWRSSPFGAGFPNAESNGNHHQWTVWSAWKDYTGYEKDSARFVTEFGFQAGADPETMKEVTLESDRHIQSAVMERHNKQVEGTERLIRFQAAHYRLGERFDRFLYKSQLVQAHALKCGVEHWRRRKFLSAGALFWQLNDCWPVSSWAVIDSGLRPKAGYYFAKRFYAPLLVSFKGVPEGVEVWVTNDRTEPAAGSVAIALRSVEGKQAWLKVVPLSVPQNTSHRVFTIDRGRYEDFDPSIHYLHATLRDQGAPLSENRFFFLEPKHLGLPRARVTGTFRKTKDGTVELKLRSDKFAMGVCARIHGGETTFSNNFVDLDAGGAVTIVVASRFGIKELQKKLSLGWL
jgi:beta-mannosidase